jgi:DNA-binding MarR family transcriptional regulator
MGDMDDAWHLERDIPLIGLLAEVKAAVAEDLYDRLADAGFADLRPAHGCVFSTLDQQGARLTALADRSGLTKQAVGEAVADLERLGYVERVPDPVDRRAKIIKLTERGVRALAAAEQILADIERRFAAEVGEKRFADFRETLRQLFLLTHAPAGTRARAA